MSDIAEMVVLPLYCMDYSLTSLTIFTLGCILSCSYKGPLLNEQLLKEALEAGHRNAEYTRLVAWLCKEIGSLGGLDEVVNPINDPEDSSHFLLELSSFLTELRTYVLSACVCVF